LLTDITRGHGEGKGLGRGKNHERNPGKLKNQIITRKKDKGVGEKKKGGQNGVTGLVCHRDLKKTKEKKSWGRRGN